MNAEELKHKLAEIFNSNLEFNREFDHYVENIKNIEETLLPWCILLKQGKINPIKPEKLKEGIVFIKKIGSSNRCIVIKVINGEFKEIHLADHKYYNFLMKKLSLKKSSNQF